MDYDHSSPGIEIDNVHLYQSTNFLNEPRINGRAYIHVITALLFVLSHCFSLMVSCGRLQKLAIPVRKMKKIDQGQRSKRGRCDLE